MSGPQKASPSASSDSPRKDATTITNLAPELLLQIYQYLEQSSHITALNSTSQKMCSIWRLNAHLISDVVLPRAINCYDSELELLEIQQGMQGIDLSSPEPIPTIELREIQQQGKTCVLEARTKGYWGRFSGNIPYQTVLDHNKGITSIAKKASHASSLFERGVLADGIPPPLRYPAHISREVFSASFCRLYILATLESNKAMASRVYSMGTEEVEEMVEVAAYLAWWCPDKDKVFLGVSCRSKKKWQQVGRSAWQCRLDSRWQQAFIEVCKDGGDSPLAKHMGHNPWRDLFTGEDDDSGENNDSGEDNDS